jgi:hypothetical protein
MGNFFSNYFNLRQKENLIIGNEYILKEKVEEQDKFIKYFLNLSMLLGSFGFLIVGTSSFLGFNLILFLDATNIVFFPQGIIMSFYGFLGLILALNQIFILYLGVGEGFNEFDKTKGTVTIYRKGFFGENSDVYISYPIADVVRLMLYKIDLRKSFYISVNVRAKAF